VPRRRRRELPQAELTQSLGKNVHAFLVRLSLIENDVGLCKMLQHRHLVQLQLEAVLECDYLTQAFLDASRMYQAEAEAVLFLA